MACTLATVQTAACSSGIGKLTAPVALWQVIAQSLLAASPTPESTLEEVLARACESGIGHLTDHNSLIRIIAQNLCSLNSS